MFSNGAQYAVLALHCRSPSICESKRHRFAFWDPADTIVTSTNRPKNHDANGGLELAGKLDSFECELGCAIHRPAEEPGGLGGCNP